MKTLRSVFILIFLTCLITGCLKDSIAPNIPPSGSMVMEFDDFWSGSAKSLAIPKSNFLHAAVHVSWWNLVLTVQLAIPVATFMESFNHQAAWNGTSKEWIWTYPVTVGNDVYKAELHGKENGNETDWNMYISKTGGFTDFLWYSGTSMKDNSAGTWYLNKSPDNPTDFLQIDWEMNSEGISGIRYLNITPGANENGSYIKYGSLKDSSLDAYYDIYGKSDDRLINIKWNSSSHTGRVKDQKFFSDSDWHCWDELLLNTVCQ